MLFKARQQAPNGVAYAQPHIPKLRLHYGFSSPRNAILSLSIRSHLISTSEVICLIEPSCWALKESDLAVTDLLFHLVQLPCHPCCLLPIKAFHLVQLLGAASYLSARRGAALFMNRRTKPIKSFKFTQVNFVFLTIQTNC